MTYTSKCSKCNKELEYPKEVKKGQAPVCFACKAQRRREYSRKRIGVRNPTKIEEIKETKKSLKITKDNLISYEEWVKTLDQKKLLDWIENVKSKRLARGWSAKYTG